MSVRKDMTIRVDVVDASSFECMKTWLEKHSTRYLIALEVGSETGKMHYQGIVELDLAAKNRDAWAKSLKDAVPRTKANQYSLTHVKKLEVWRAYVCKQNDIKLQVGYTDDEVKAYKEASFDPDAKKGKKATDGYLEYMEKALYRGIDVLRNKKYELDLEIIIRHTLLWFKKHTKVNDNFIIMRFVHLCQLTLHKDDSEYMSRRIDDIMTLMFK